MKNKSKNSFEEVSDGEIKITVGQFRAKKFRKNPQDMQELPKCIRLEELIGGLKKKLTPSGLPVYPKIMPKADRLSQK